MRISKSTGWKMVFIRELRRMVSRPVYVIITIVLPFIFLLFFGTFMQEGMPERLPIGIIDHDFSTLSRNFIRQIDATQQTKCVSYYQQFSEARSAMQEGHIYGFIEFPSHMQKDIMAGHQPKVNFYYNQSYLVAGSLSLKNLSTMFNTLSGGVNLETRLAKGQNEKESMGQIQPISPEIHAIGNPYTNYSIYLVNILLPAMLELIILLTTVYCIGIELKKSSSPKWLRYAGGSFFQALVGKMLPYTIIFSSMAILYDVFLYKFMQFPLNNSIIWIFLASVLLVLTSQTIGIIMIGAFPTLKDSMNFAGLYGILAFSYSGLIYPIEGMPIFLQGLSLAFPIRFFFKIYQCVAINSFTPVYSIPNYLYMLVFLVLPIIIWKRLRKAVIELNYPKV